MMDQINAFFELSGGLFVALNAWDIWKKKRVAGQTLATCLFFWVWGVWNLIFYPALGQWTSAAGATFVLIANTAMLSLVFVYRERKQKPQRPDWREPIVIAKVEKE